MRPSVVWEVMTPTTSVLPQLHFVRWRVIADHQHEAERMAEQAGLELGLTFEGDVQVRREGVCYA